MRSRVLPTLCATLALLLAVQPSHASGSRKNKRAAKSTTPALHGPLAAQIAQILNAPTVRQCRWGISITTLDGTPLYTLNDDQRLTPASNEKLFTTAAAFALLPQQLAFETQVLAQGPVANGTLTGDVVLKGSGDWSMSARVLPYSARTERTGDPLAAFDALAAQVAAIGVTHIAGSVIGDDTAWVYQPLPSGWSWDDLQWEEGAPVSALSVNDNVQYLAVLPGASAGEPPTFTWLPETGYYTIESTVQTVAAAPGIKADVGAHRDPGSRVVRLWGTLPVGSPGVHLALAIQEPALFAAQAFRDRLLAHGIRVVGAPAAKHFYSRQTPGALDAAANSPGLAAGTLLARRTSPPLAEDLTVTNKASQNLHAEMLLMDIARQASPPGITPSREDGIRAVHAFLAQTGIVPDDIVLRDGSGVSQQDLTTPRAITTLLRYAATQPWGDAFRATLPIGGVDGTLNTRFLAPPMRGRVSAKTGTLAEVDALSGYVTGMAGKVVIFSILVNGHIPGSGVRTAIDQIVTAIAQTN